MGVRGFKIMCLFLLLFEFGFCGKSPPSGPFRTTIVSIEDCVNPSKPYVKDPPVVFNGVTRNNTIDGNITFFRDTRYMKVRVKSFIMRNGKWKQVHIFNNIDCHGMVIHVICMMMNVKYDRKNCMYYKGSYSFENIDVNQLLHVWVSTAIYGHVLWRTETYMQSGTFYCKEFDTISEPA
ncbi:hypothetical protein B5X24_HaOG210067 [Helicoverpa armigera]|nr:hypothetical protein B5X24_HaOG210067 [Helicoverpa armigera]